MFRQLWTVALAALTALGSLWLAIVTPGCRNQCTSSKPDAKTRETVTTHKTAVETPLLKSAGPVTATRPSQPIYDSSLRLAVTMSPKGRNWDDMGAWLKAMGPGYQYTPISLDDLLEPDRLAKYEIVFVPCSPVPRTWVVQRVRAGVRDDTAVFAARPDNVARLRKSLRRFVEGGGTLYASDWQFDLLAIAFPEMVDEAKVGRGEVQNVAAEVVDPGLRKRLGPMIPLRFEKSDWRPAAFTGRDVTTYLQGQYKLASGDRQTGPLLVSFPVGNGTVIFASFHNEAQNKGVENELCRCLVFTTITAREESRVKRTMVRDGLSPQERHLLDISPGWQPLGGRYELAKAGPLRFALGFENQGARLRLRVTGPGGRKEERSDTKTFTIDIPDAKPSFWNYSVTPLTVPYQDFPFTLTIGGQSPSANSKPADKDSHETKQASRLAVDLGGGVKLQMVLIPPGEFAMGSRESAEDTATLFNKTYGGNLLKADGFADEHPQHRVRITRPFYLGTYHVTRGQFRRFVADTGYSTDAETGDRKGASGSNPDKNQFEFSEEYSWRNTGFEQTDEHPVVNVNWNDAIAFCKWLSRKEGKTYRLPTEAEWEYACRAGTTTWYNNGDDLEMLAKVGNVADATFTLKFPAAKYTIEASDGYVFTAPVGSFTPNAFGLYDMHGNAWQWCADWYGKEYYAASPAADPTGPDSGHDHVVRGGSWGCGPYITRSAGRYGFAPGFRGDGVGFRVARTN
jgi:formylglycine-generating enzyme required for sulfatase activity